jgi:hypothetical protein
MKKIVHSGPCTKLDWRTFSAPIPCEHSRRFANLNPRKRKEKAG